MSLPPLTTLNRLRATLVHGFTVAPELPDPTCCPPGQDQRTHPWTRPS